VAVRSLGGDGLGLRRGSIDQALPSGHGPRYRKAMSSGLGPNSFGTDLRNILHQAPVLPRSSVDFAYSGAGGSLRSADFGLNENENP